MVQWQSSVAMTDTTWLSTPKIFTIWPFTEKKIVNPGLHDQLLKALTPNKNSNLFMLENTFWLTKHFHMIGSAWVLAGLGLC